LLTTRAYDLISDTNVPLNTLDFPALEFEMSRVGDRPVTRFTERLERQMNLENVAKRLCSRPCTFDPIQFALTCEMLFERSTLGAHAVKLAAEASGWISSGLIAKPSSRTSRPRPAPPRPPVPSPLCHGTADATPLREAIAQEEKALALNPARLDSWENHRRRP
jgi:hypothetical protein